MKTGEIYKNHRELCTGCAACANVCPHDAITMKKEWKGFLYPEIDNKKCVNCGLCQKACPVNIERAPFVFPETYAYVESDLTCLLTASSGGAFGVVARYVIEQGGIVYGATMDDNYDVYYIGAETEDDLKKLHGSKYVQAYTNLIFRDVKSQLKSGRKVLFCGCPCQVAGLNQYLKKCYDNLLTMDLICHGVPSLPYFKSYVQDLLKNKDIEKFRFRYKALSDRKEETCGKRIYVGFSNRDYYMTHFLWGKGYRSSCYKCKYAVGSRPGDFTIGDYWNNENTHVLSDTSRGASLVLFNTSKSLTLKNVFANAGEFKQVNTFEDAMGKNGGQLEHPSKNDIRTFLLYFLWKLFGVRGPKFLFKIQSL